MMSWVRVIVKLDKVEELRIDFEAKLVGFATRLMY